MSVLLGSWADSMRKLYQEHSRELGSIVSAQDRGVSFPTILHSSWFCEHNLAQPAQGKGHIIVAEGTSGGRHNPY